MKALTLTQPWATLVARGEKKIETRSWGTHYRGPLAIHAAKALPKSWREFTHEAFRDALEEVCGVNEFGAPVLTNLPTGAVIAVVTLTDVVPMTVDVPPFYAPQGYALSPREWVFGHYGPGRYAWILDDVLAFDPVPYGGRQRLWELPAVVIPWENGRLS